MELKTFLHKHKIGIISILVPDLNRETAWRIFYSLLHNVFKYERIQIKAHTYFYESMEFYNKRTLRLIREQESFRKS